MRIVDKTVIFDMTIEAGGIMFYASSTKREEIDYIEKAFNNISKEEEEKLISILNEMFCVKKPCLRLWRATAGGKPILLHLEGYQIEVTTV